MVVGALGMGFTLEDLKSMPPDRLMWMVHVSNSLQDAPDKEPETQEGTIEQLKNIL